MTKNECGYQVPDGVTVDIVLIGYNPNNEIASIALIQRGKEPFKDYWALPGGFLNPGEDVLTAAFRELHEETNIKGAVSFHYEILIPRSSETRDPRGWIVSMPMLLAMPFDRLSNAVAGDDAKDFYFFNLDNALDMNNLAFDHKAIITEGICRFREWRKRQ